MKSVILKDIKKLEVEDVKEPEAKNGEVLISVTKVGICGSDLHYFESGEPKGLVLGHEYCGVVMDPGDRIDLDVGDRVTSLPISPCGECSACKSGNHQYCKDTWTHATGLSLTNPGALQEKTTLRPDLVIKIPDNVTDEEAAMVEPTAVGLHAIHLANIKVGAKVLIIGGGIIGLVSALFAKKEGASYVAVSETNEARGKKAIDLKIADEYYDAKDEKMLEKCYMKTGEGFDFVIDCCGNAKAVTTALTAVKPGGTVILVGVATGPITIPTVLMVMRELTVKGAIAYTKEEFETCLHLISEKQIDVLKFVDEIVGLNDVQSSFDKLYSGNTDTIKILVDPRK